MKYIKIKHKLISVSIFYSVSRWRPLQWRHYTVRWTDLSFQSNSSRESGVSDRKSDGLFQKALKILNGTLNWTFTYLRALKGLSDVLLNSHKFRNWVLITYKDSCKGGHLKRMGRELEEMVLSGISKVGMLWEGVKPYGELLSEYEAD